MKAAIILPFFYKNIIKLCRHVIIMLKYLLLTNRDSYYSHVTKNKKEFKYKRGANEK